MGKYLNRILGIGIPYLSMNLFLCHGFPNDIKSIVILKCPKKDVGILFFKRIWYFWLQFNNLAKLPKEVKKIFHAEEIDNSYYIMTCNNTIASILNTLKKLLLYKSLHSSYIKTRYNNTEEIINNTFIIYLEPLLDDINNPALLQEWKLNIHAAAYEKSIGANVYKNSSKINWSSWYRLVLANLNNRYDSVVSFYHNYRAYYKYTKAK